MEWRTNARGGTRRGGSGGMRGRGAPLGRGGSRGGGYYRRQYRDENDPLSSSAPGGDYTDYPPEFTTLAPVFPVVPEFIMPYVTPAYYQAPFTPPACAVVEDGQIASSFVPVDQAIVTEMVKKQM